MMALAMSMKMNETVTELSLDEVFATLYLRPHMQCELLLLTTYHCIFEAFA